MKNKLCCIMGLVLLAVLLGGCGRGGRVDVGEYILLEVSGAQGQGTASARIDGYSLYEALNGRPADTNDLAAMLEVVRLEGAFSLSTEPNSGLANGDIVTVRAEAADVAKELGLSGGTATRSFTVEGLGLHPYDALVDPAWFDEELAGQVQTEGGRDFERVLASGIAYFYRDEDAILTEGVTAYRDIQLESLYLFVSDMASLKNPATVYAVFSAEVSFKEEQDAGRRYFVGSYQNPTYTTEGGAQLDWEGDALVGGGYHGGFATPAAVYSQYIEPNEAYGTVSEIPLG